MAWQKSGTTIKGSSSDERGFGNRKALSPKGTAAKGPSEASGVREVGNRIETSRRSGKACSSSCGEQGEAGARRNRDSNQDSVVICQRDWTERNRSADGEVVTRIPGPSPARSACAFALTQNRGTSLSASRHPA